MTSYLIISKDEKVQNQKAEEIIKEKQVDPFDSTHFDLRNFDEKTPKKSWGISDVKELQKKILLKPFKGEWKAVTIHDADVLTLEAQNALLKVLEEPPSHTLLILTTKTKEALLPTILSRCQLIDLPTNNEIPPERKKTIDAFFGTLPDTTIGDKLKQAELLSKNKDEAMKWISDSMVILHDELSNNPSLQLSRLQQLQSSYQTIKTTNTNLRLTLEHLFLRLK